MDVDELEDDDEDAAAQRMPPPGRRGRKSQAEVLCLFVGPGLSLWPILH